MGTNRCNHAACCSAAWSKSRHPYTSKKLRKLPSAALESRATQLHTGAAHAPGEADIQVISAIQSHLVAMDIIGIEKEDTLETTEEEEDVDDEVVGGVEEMVRACCFCHCGRV